MQKDINEIKTKSKVRHNKKTSKHKENSPANLNIDITSLPLQEKNVLDKQEFDNGLNILKQISSAEKFLIIINGINEESKFYECLKEFIVKQLDKKYNEFTIQLSSDNQFSNCFFIKPNEEDSSNFLQRIYLTLIEYLSTTPGELVFKNLLLLQKCLSIFHTLKLKYITKINEDLQFQAIKIIKGLNFVFIKNFIDFFDLYNIIKDKYITEILFEFKNKPDIAIKYVKLFDINDKIILKDILEASFRDKSNFNTLKKIVEIDPSFIPFTFKSLLDLNWTKQCTDLYLNLKLDDLFLRQTILEKCSIKAFIHYYKEYLGKKINIIHLEELFKHCRVVIKKLLNKLINDSKLDEALYIIRKQNYEVDIEFNKLLFLYRNMINKQSRYFNGTDDLLNEMKLLDKNQSSFYDDTFSPVTPNCLKIPLELSCVKFVDSEESIKFLDLLKTGSVIGIDCEWKPTISKLEPNTGVAIMQLSNENYSCVIDMIRLQDCKIFLEKLIEVFTNKKIISFDFENDLQKLNSKFKDIFNSKDVNIDSIDLYKILITKYKELKIKSLTDTVKFFLKEPLCKFEQCSNWENRPLRLHQLHYASLDAFVLVMLYNIMTK